MTGCNVAGCQFEQPMTPSEVEALTRRYVTIEFAYDTPVSTAQSAHKSQ